ncbi:MAG: proteasome endopeptidase complex, archaeal, alpha subunit [Thermoprotei archaeon]|nr:MAG: proteasome endopeptidase complex, archaeal, alpha subunit [Thermoprotei archaeon]
MATHKGGRERAITIFSPDGRLFQVEYANEAVRKGLTAVGIRVKEGIVLMAERKEFTRLMEPVDKIYQIDEHIGLVFSGLPSDARVLIDRARLEAQINRLIYDEPISVESLVKAICDIKQIYTQHGGVRPFGVAFIIGGIDFKGPELFGTDPSGAYRKYYAHAIGAGEQTARDILEKEYDHKMSLDDAIALGLKVMNKVIEKGISPEKLEIGIADVKTKRFKKLSQDEIAKLLEKYKVS